MAGRVLLWIIIHIRTKSRKQQKSRIFSYGASAVATIAIDRHYIPGHSSVQNPCTLAWRGRVDFGISGHVEHDLYVIITDCLCYVVIMILMEDSMTEQQRQLPNSADELSACAAPAHPYILYTRRSFEQEVIAGSFGNCLMVRFVNLKVKIVFCGITYHLQICQNSNRIDVDRDALQ